MIDRRIAEHRADLALIATENGSQPAEEQDGDRKPSQATRLVALALDQADLFRSPDGIAYATVHVEGHNETWPLRSKRFRAWMQRAIYVADRKVAGSQPVQDALGVLEGRALFEAPEEAVALRVAGDDAAIYLDLGDSSWLAVEITASGWRLAQPPVRMRRSPSMAALPVPTVGGSIDELRRFFNVRDEADWRLLVAWLVAALRPRGPYPVLVMHGEHGAAKSTVARILRSLVDPNTAPLRADPRNPHDLMISAENGWVTAYDNLSRLPPWLSDALCRLSTGGGFATRELYSDAEETIFDAQRPAILTGIEELATRADLLDRALVVYLPTISEAERSSERELWTDFERVRPRILGALLDAAACAVRELPQTRLDSAPRMADFAEWIVAAEPALPWASGDFLAAYTGNRGEANEITLEASPIASTLRELAEAGFEGIATDLLERLAEIAGEPATRRKAWPGSPRALSGELRRIAPNLRAVGVEVDFLDRERGRRPIRIGRQRSVTTVTKVTDHAQSDGPGDGRGRPTVTVEADRDAARDGRDGCDGPPRHSSKDVAATEESEVERLRQRGFPP